MTKFQQDVYEQIREGAKRSAFTIAPILIRETMRYSRGGEPIQRPLRVLDVGCGEGWWSWVLQQSAHVGQVVSIDQAAPDYLAEGVQVKTMDLEKRTAFGRDFHLTLCLETAEHLPASAANGLVRGLVRATDPRGIIAFSAAIPGQGGHGHLNEQWPAYWDSLFRVHGWMLTDPLRDSLWDAGVEPWYAQNLLIGVRGTSNGTLYAAAQPPRALVHPAVYEARLRDVAYWRERYLEADAALITVRA